MHQTAHDAQLLKIENHAEQIFTQHPEHLKDLFKDLQELRRSESKGEFAKDLEAINLKLHEDGWLPMMELVMAPRGGFRLRRQSDSEWDREAAERQQQYNDKSYVAPRPAATPGGYNSGYRPHEGASHRGGYAPRATYDPEAHGNPGHFKYDPHVSGDAAQRILQTAHQSSGHQMWRETNHGASGGREGCAASVSAVLRNAGVSHVNEMECHRLQAALQKEGWTMTNKPSPGDVVFGYGGLSRAHVGIVDQNGKVMDNHSSTGQWSTDSLSYFGNWHQQVFLHPPQGSDSASQAAAKMHQAAQPSTPAG